MFNVAIDSCTSVIVSAIIKTLLIETVGGSSDNNS